LTNSSHWIGSDGGGGGSEAVTTGASANDAASFFAPPVPTNRIDDMWLRAYFSRVTKNGPLFRSIISNILGRPTMTAAAHSSGRLFVSLKKENFDLRIYDRLPIFGHRLIDLSPDRITHSSCPHFAIHSGSRASWWNQRPWRTTSISTLCKIFDVRLPCVRSRKNIGFMPLLLFSIRRIRLPFLSFRQEYQNLRQWILVPHQRCGDQI